MITAIVGHRGSGKSAFLHRAQQLLSAAGLPAEFVDIDHEIEVQAGQPISELFPAIGEEEFRTIERRVAGEWFERLADRDRAFVSLGAGFDGGIPEGVTVLWVQRSTDGHGRIFLDRPALDPGALPLDEFLGRFAARRDRYRTLADETYIVAEGCTEPTAADRFILGSAPGELGGWLTVTPGDLDPRRWGRFLAKRLGWGVTRFEVRDDLVGSENLPHLRAIPAERLVIAYRTGERWLDALAAPGILSDWALELGEPPPAMDIVSLHDREAGESVADAAGRLVAAGSRSHLKLAVEVGSFDELGQGHRWRAQAPDRRSFLPRSADGQWSWYRQINKGSMLVNFFREGGGSAPDQPTMAEWAGTPAGSRSFAAILGLPVDHSRTPCEHAEFFRTRNTPVVRVPLGECTAASLDLLAGLGLTHAAVTAPLKETMFGLCDDVVGTAGDLGSVNTIMLTDGRWRGTNTDLAGITAATEHVAPNAAVALWGGGGTKATVMAAVPSAVPYSARTGEPRPGVTPLPPGGPDIVIWAVGRDRQPACRWPPAEWRPSEVIDLNYTDDSPGLEYARRHGIAYRSGVEMFKAQAAQQREFWDGG